MTVADRLPAFETIGARRGVVLAPYVTVRVGGPADWFAEPRTRDEMIAAIGAARAAGIAVTLLGGGANVIVSDAGVRGLVVHPRGDLCRIDGLPPSKDARPRWRFHLGAPIAEIVRTFKNANEGGAEWAIGIPGTIGGATFMNAGIREGCLADLVEAVEVLTPGGEVVAIPAEACAFGYRTSRFQTTGEIVLSTVIRAPGRPYDKALAERLTAYRTRTQPYGLPNSGSVFRNPEGDFAGRLIEAAGMKGFRVGGAEVSRLHANFITNVGGATAADVLAVIEAVERKVLEVHGVRLEREVRWIGEPS